MEISKHQFQPKRRMTRIPRVQCDDYFYDYRETENIDAVLF